jgi:ParB family chromosome partitioning protein
MPQRPALGRGLSSLLSAGRITGGALHEIPVSAITPNRRQPRRSFNPSALAELSATVKEQGVAQPILVRRAGNGYELIAGERRWRAAKMAGLKTVPALVRQANDREALELALIENLHREDLNAMEEAAAYQELLKDMTQEELGKKIGRDRTTLANTLRLLKLPKDAQAAVSDGRITAGHARAILALETPAAQTALFRRIIRDGLSVRQAEAAARRTAKPAGSRAHPDASASADRAASEEMSRALGTKVRIRRAGRRGAIMIEYYSAEELDRLITVLSRR